MEFEPLKWIQRGVAPRSGVTVEHEFLRGGGSSMRWLPTTSGEGAKHRPATT